MLSSRAALALDCRQHQRRAQTASASSAKMTSPGSGWAVSLAPRSTHGSSPRAKRTVIAAGHGAQVEDRDRQRAADADQVGEVHERADGRQIALLGEPPQERLRGRAVLRGIDPEAAEDAAPGRQRRQLGEWRLAEALADGQLLRLEGGREIGRCRGIAYVRGVDDAPDDTGEAARSHLGRNRKRAMSPVCQQRLARGMCGRNLDSWNSTSVEFIDR